MASPETIMFIRHGEKPGEHGPPHGVKHSGETDEHSLSVRGWTRAGGLAGIFAHAPSPAHPELVVPARIYATKSTHEYHSKREVATATPLAERIGVKVNDNFEHGQEKQLGQAILDSSAPTLVVWHHGSIPAVLRHLPISNENDVPHEWPEDRFDLIWVLTWDAAEKTYRFSIDQQELLSGDALKGSS